MTREEAIKRLSELKFYCGHENGIWREDINALKMAIAALREQTVTDGHQLEPVTNRNGLNGWISVEDRLPSAEFLDKEIIVCKLNRFGEQRVCVTRFWGTHSALWNDITHWMPLPSAEGLE